RIIQNRAPLLPQMTASAQYQRTTNNFAPTPGLNPTLPSPGPVASMGAHNSLNTVDNWNFGVQLNQLVFDSGVSIDRFRASKALAQAQSSTEKATIFNILSQVRTNYFTARAQKALIQVATENLQNQERHLSQIEGFVRVGARPEIDLAQARTDRANANVQL